MAYYRYICPYGLAKFKRFAVNVWNVAPNVNTDEQIAFKGLDRMESYMKEVGLVISLIEIGVIEEMINEIAENTLIMDGGYKVLSKGEIVDILKKSM